MTDDGVTVGWTLRERSVREFARDLRVSEAHLRVVLAQHGTPVVEKPRKARREPRPAPAVRRHPVASFTVANRARRETAARHVVAAARDALASGADLSPKDRAVLAARVEHPGLSLSALGETLGMSKDVYASQLRRALAAARKVA